MLTSPLSRSSYQLLMLSRDPISHTFHQGNLIKYQMPSEQGTTCCLFDDSVSHLDHESFQILLVFRWQVITYPFLDGWGCLYLHLTLLSPSILMLGYVLTLITLARVASSPLPCSCFYRQLVTSLSIFFNWPRWQVIRPVFYYVGGCVFIVPW